MQNTKEFNKNLVLSYHVSIAHVLCGTASLINGMVIIIKMQE